MPQSPKPRAATVEELVRAREARGLSWSVMARLAFVGLFTAMSFLHLAGLIPTGIVAERDSDAYYALGIELLAAGPLIYFLMLARRGRRLELAGYGAVALDVILVSILPLIWAYNSATPGGTPAFLMKNELFTLCVPLVIMSAMALRPAYPLLSASGFIGLHLALMAFFFSSSSPVISYQYTDHFYTAAVNPGVAFVRVIVFAVLGVSLALMAHMARRTIYDAVELEVANMEIKERQAEMVLEGKLTAMSGLVAGVAHELNTPLGVVRSGLETSEGTLNRLAPIDDEDGSRKRTVDATRMSLSAARAGLERMSRVIGSLTGFARLDQSELERADVRDGLNDTLALVEKDRLGAIEVVRDLADVPNISCRPKELNQVFMTLIENAIEAMKGEGTLRLATSRDNGWVKVAIADTGPGIAPEVLEHLFEFQFNEKRGRMALGLGLPTARRIVERHGGTLDVRTRLGEGTEFTLGLPVDPS